MIKKSRSNVKTMVWAFIGAALSVTALLILVGPQASLNLMALAFLAGGAAGGLLSHRNSGQHEFSGRYDGNEVKMLLGQEELDIIKKKIPTGEVKIYEELITQEETITVPTTRAELVIKNHKPTQKSEEPETIRIPIWEERLNIAKQPVMLNDVSVLKRTIRETKHIDTALKKETVNVDREET